MQDAGDYVTDYHVSFAPMEALGWQVTTVPWRSAPDWDLYDAVYVCTPWDYPQHAEEFLQVLEAIEASRARLCNAISTIRWNLEKTYLRDVAARGDAIVPSSWYDGFDATQVESFFAEHETHKVVLKPTIGANAQDTFVLERPVNDATLELLAKTFHGRRFFVQPFIDNVTAEGEFSLFFFNGVYSHAILKTPQAGDFRVQEEHGGVITACDPPQTLRDTAQQVFSHLSPMPVYGRGDWVRGADGDFLLMELELIEPSLYLRTDRGAASRFAVAIDQWFEELTGK